MSNNTSTADMTIETITAIIGEATGAKPRVLHTGGGCEVVAWRSDEYVCWLSGDDAVLPTSIEDGLVLGIYTPDPTEALWPSEEGCEGLRFYFANWANAESLAGLLIEARADICV